jgi:hypothetical protein
MEANADIDGDSARFSLSSCSEWGELLKCSHVEEFAKVGLLSRGSAAHALHEPLRLGWIDDMSKTFGPARLIVCRTSDLVGFKIDLRVTWASSLHGMNEGLNNEH